MTVFTDKVQKYNARLMKDLGITRTQACGIWGNLGAETGGFTQLQELKPTVAGSAGGLGWMQWTGVKAPNGRRYKFVEWCKANHLEPTSDEANYRYLVKETLTDEAHSLSQLKKTDTIDAATETFMAQNLRPGVQHLDSRKRWAAKAWDATVNQEAPVKIEEIKKTTDSQKTTTAVATGSLVVAAMIFFREHWMAISIAGLAVGGAIWYGIHRYKQIEEEKIINEEAAKLASKTKKKGKVNGQD